MTVIFNGQRFAAHEEDILVDKVRELKENYQITPRLATIIVGQDPASKLYVNLKKRAAERLGCKLDIIFFEKTTVSNLIKRIKKLNNEKTIHGIMIQLPLPKNLQKHQTKIINSIISKKDVDGLRINSPFTHPTSMAILNIIENPLTIDKKTKILLIGSKGFVGTKTLQLIKLQKYNIKGIDINDNLKAETLKADLIISATGTSNLVKAEMIKKGIDIIDVGSPKGDVSPAAAKKARFVTPVPGGLGPVTITCLLDNLISAAYNAVTTHT